MTTSITTAEPFPEAPSLLSPSTPDLDIMRGRKRDRSPMRSDIKKSMRPDESSTLRGRSRRRAASPSALLSRNSSPSLMSPSKKHMIIYNPLRDSRREHCPSRGVSPTRQKVFRRRQRTRSRSRGPRLELELHALSSLRNELRPHEEEVEEGKGE